MAERARQNKEAEWFGFRKVRAGEKTRLVRGVFDSVAENYDLMNDLMSLGVHRIWKNVFVRRAAPRPGQKVLDLAGGTGDIAFRMAGRMGADADITVCDINPEMLRVGRARAVDNGILSGLSWVEGNAEDLPFPDNSFDLCTIAFGLRNVERIDTALGDIHRVLKPGGRFLCLEFSHVQTPGLDRIYDAYSFNILPLLGKAVARDEDSYRYLAESIRQFPKQEELKERLQAAGFVRTGYRNLSGGIAAMHWGWKA